MNFDRIWSTLALEAEHDRFGMSRIAAAHNQLAHRAEQDAKDATRYRWTVAHWYDLEIILEQFGSLPPGAGSLTAMIDAAMAREAPDAT